MRSNAVSPLAFALVSLLVSLSGCGEPRKVEGKSTDDSRSGQPALFTVPPEQLAHLRVSPVRKASWPISVRTTGTVDFDADHTTQAITQVNGPISRIVVDTGSRVKQGDPLLYVSSPDVAAAISAYRKARNREQLAQRTLDRMKLLLDRGAVATKDFEGAQADFNDARTDVQTSLQSLKIYGITAGEIELAESQGVPISPELAVRAPISGTVVQKLVSPGQLIQASTTVCFVLSDMSTVWVQGHIFDRDLPSVRIGDPAVAANPAFDHVFRGVVAYIGAMVDPATRTTPVRIVTQNPGGLLKKDMFLEATIHTRTQNNVLTVPASAVLHDAQNEPMVYVEVEPRRFAQRLVAVDGQQKDQIAIVSGVPEGDKVVSEGAVFLQFANSYQ